MATRTRRLSIMQMPPLGPHYSRNLYLFPAIAFAVVIVFICETSRSLHGMTLMIIIVCYIPFFQELIGSTTVALEHWFLPAAFGVVLLLLDETRKFVIRGWPQGFVARIAW